MFLFYFFIIIHIYYVLGHPRPMNLLLEVHVSSNYLCNYCTVSLCHILLSISWISICCSIILLFIWIIWNKFIRTWTWTWTINFIVFLKNHYPSLHRSECKTSRRAEKPLRYPAVNHSRTMLTTMSLIGAVITKPWVLSGIMTKQYTWSSWFGLPSSCLPVALVTYSLSQPSSCIETYVKSVRILYIHKQVVSQS